MNNLEFNNKYNVKLCTLSLLPDRFEMEDQLFSAECIWLLASIIQFTEISTYYQIYNIFPSEYLYKISVTPTLSQSHERLLVPESQIPILDITTEIVEHNSNQAAAVVSSRKKLDHDCRDNRRNNEKRTIPTTRSRTSFQNQGPLNTKGEFGKRCGRQRARNCGFHKQGDSGSWGRLHSRCNITNNILTPIFW